MLVDLRHLSNWYKKFTRTIIDYGEYSATCSDIYESFADGKCLDNVFMQCFIQCVIDDAKNQQTSMSSNSLILDVNVGVNYRNIHTPYSYTNWMNPSILTPFISFIAVTTQLWGTGTTQSQPSTFWWICTPHTSRQFIAWDRWIGPMQSGNNRIS